MNIKADLIYSPERLRPARCQVEKVVEVGVPEFDAFLGAPQEAWPFLEANAELMHQWMGVDHCLLVLAEGRTNGVLANSEGNGLDAMLHDSFGLTLQEIRAHNYMSDREIAHPPPSYDDPDSTQWEFHIL